MGLGTEPDDRVLGHDGFDTAYGNTVLGAEQDEDVLGAELDAASLVVTAFVHR